MQRRAIDRLSVAFLIVLFLLPTFGVAVRGQSPIELRGTWATEVVARDGTRFDSTLVIREQTAGGSVSGHWDINGKSASGNVRGSLDGERLTLTSSKASGSYRYTGTVSMRNGAPSWRGTWSHPIIKEYRGTFTAQLVKPFVRRSPLGGAGASATIVMCDRDLLAVTDDARLECTAMVSDASGQPGSKAPTGTVRWVTKVGDVTPATCELHSSGGSTSWCAVALTARAGDIPLGTAPPVTASYPGDDTFGPSEGSPELYGAASSYDESDQYGPGCNPAAGPYPSFSCGDPVHPGTGNLVMVGTDLAVGGRGPGLAVERTYDSLAAADGATGRFGVGWYDLYGARIDIGPGMQRTVVLGGGQTVPFRATKSGFAGPGWATATLAKASRSGYRLTFADGTSYTFDRSGRLVRVADHAGEAVTLTYDTAGLLVAITDGSGRAISFTSDSNGRVLSATDPAGRSASYSYVPAGDLVAVTDVAGGVTRYAYDDRHRLVSITDPVGAIATNAYDDQDRVVTQTDPIGNTLSFAYVGNFPDAVTVVTDGIGVRTGYEFQAGVAVAVTVAIDAAAPSVTRYRYDQHSRLVAVIDPDRRTMTLRRDAAGDVISSTDPIGRTTTSTWDDERRLTSVTSPLGITSRITRNKLGLPVRVTHAAGTPEVGVVTIERADPEHPGDITSVIDPLGAATTFGFDEHGSLSSVTDPLGGTERMSRDILGQPLTMTDALGAMSSVERDVRGNVISTTDRLGATTSSTWDAVGELDSWTDALGQVTSLERDVIGRPIALHLADGSSQEATWTAVGSQASQVDALGATSSTGYDDHGRATRWTDASGATWSTTYDPADQVTSTTDPGGVTTTYAYDAAGQLLGVSYGDGTPAVSWTYDADGRRATMTDGTGTTRYTWDARGRLLSVTDGSGQTTGSTWDARGGMTTLTYPDGSVVDHDYDLAGRLIAVRDGAGNESRFTYDAAGRMTGESLGNGVEVQMGYDRAGAIVELDTTLDGEPLLSFGYERDASGKVVAIQDARLSAAITARRDVRGRLTALGDQRFELDAAGNLRALRGRALAYAAGGRLTSGTGPNSGTYGYDDAGRRVEQTADDGIVVARYAYDGAGRLVQATDQISGSATASTYDGDGLRTHAIVPSGGLDAAFTWQHTSTDPMLLDDGTSRYVYGPGGMPLAQIARDGAVTWFHTDQSGNIRALSDATGEVVATFDWDAYGVQTDATGDAATRLGFQGLWTDPGTGLQVLPARVYDALTGQFLTVDPKVGSTHHPYAFAAGDPLTFGDPSGREPRLYPPLGKRRNVLAGHGNWRPEAGYTIVPRGTSIVFHQPAGSSMTDEYGIAIEQGTSTGYREVYGPGTRIPNYALGDPLGLKYQETSWIVDGGWVPLSKILKPGMGRFDWAACRSPTRSSIRRIRNDQGQLVDEEVTGHVRGPEWGVNGPVYSKEKSGMMPDPAWFDWESDQFFTDA